MRPKSLVLLILALGCGLVASIGISEIIDSQGTDAVSAETEPILIASADIERNSVLSSKNLKFKEWPKDSIPEGAVRDPSEVEGFRPLIRIAAGMVIQQGMLGTGGQRPDEQIPSGYRVATVRVGVEDGSKLIRPGGRVDVQVYVRASSTFKKTELKTLLNDITVFAVDSDIGSSEVEGQSVEARSVSLLLTPLQARKVTLASEIGKIRLVMRGAKDDQTADAGDEETVTAQDLFGDSTSGENEYQGEDSDLKRRLARLEEENEELKNSLASNQTMGGYGHDGKMIIFRGTAATVYSFDRESPLPTVDQQDQLDGWVNPGDQGLDKEETLDSDEDDSDLDADQDLDADDA